MASVVLENLAKRFRGPGGRDICAVREVNLSVGDGELLVLVGPSGCGKTTTLRLIAGLEAPEQGNVVFDGSIVTHVDPRDRQVAMVFQNHALYPHMTARENIESALKWRKVKPEEIEKRVGEITALLKLNACLHRLPEDLSGGEQQRVALGRALVQRPKVLLLDEPLSNLDAPLRLQLRREIARLNRQLGLTMIYVTHDQSEALALGGRIAVMDDGALQQVASARDIYEQPANLFVAGFFSLPPMNLLPGTITAGGPDIFFESSAAASRGEIFRVVVDASIRERMERYTGKDVTMGVRPEHVRLGCPSEGTANGAVICGVVEAVELLGTESLVVLRAGGASIAARVATCDAIPPGETAMVRFGAHRVYFFDNVTGRAIV
ncbi:MAG: ABC transporter ATP-binding protein [Verrucomicrobiota bacterium]